MLNSLHTGRAAEPQFNPPRPQDAPEAIRDAVILGYNILTDTAQYAPGHAGNELTCATCHLEAGRSKNSISLVGAAATYPRFSANHKGSIDLAQKVQDCFARNLNATPPALDSRDMPAYRNQPAAVRDDLAIICNSFRASHAKQ